MPSKADETKHIQKWIAERVPQLNLDQLRRMQEFIIRITTGRHEETPIPSLLDHSDDKS